MFNDIFCNSNPSFFSILKLNFILNQLVKSVVNLMCLVLFTNFIVFRTSYELEVILNHNPGGAPWEVGDIQTLERLKLAIMYKQKG